MKSISGVEIRPGAVIKKDNRYGLREEYDVDVKDATLNNAKLGDKQLVKDNGQK